MITHYGKTCCPVITSLESEIDRLVYEMYGLSEEEFGIVEGER